IEQMLPAKAQCRFGQDRSSDRNRMRDQVIRSQQKREAERCDYRAPERTRSCRGHPPRDALEEYAGSEGQNGLRRTDTEIPEPNADSEQNSEEQDLQYSRIGRKPLPK